MTTLRDFAAVPSNGLYSWLDEHDIALACTHSTRVLFIGRHDGQVVVTDEPFERITALGAGHDGEFWAASVFQLWRLENAVPPGGRSLYGGERLYVPRTARTTGQALPVDVTVLADGTPVFCSLNLSCIAVLHPRLGLTPIWAPRFVSAIVPEMRCYLSGLATRDDHPAFVTCAAAIDTERGWREQRRDGGVVLDVDTNEIVARGLCLPHSPRWHDKQLWVTQAGTGEVGIIDLADGRFETVARLDAFVRGLCFVDKFAVVGASGSRWDEIVDDLPVGDRLASRRPQMGLFIIDTETGAVDHSLQLDGTAREINDVLALPQVHRADLANPASILAQELITFPSERTAPN